MNGFSLYDYARALDASALTGVQRHVALRMALAPDRGSAGICSGSQFSLPAIARNTGYGLSTVTRAVRGLGDAGWLDVLPGGKGKRNAYRLHTPGLPGLIHNPVQSGRGSTPDPCQSDRGTPVALTGDPCRSDTPIYPLLTEVPSIVERVRARVRATCPDLTPDDDEISILITNLERSGVRNAAGYLHKCPPADIRRLLADAKPQASAPTSTNEPDDEAPDCPHGNPGGLTSAGTPRCPHCRRAAQISRSAPFSPIPDGLDRTGPPNAAGTLSTPLTEAVAG